MLLRSYVLQTPNSMIVNDVILYEHKTQPIDSVKCQFLQSYYLQLYLKKELYRKCLQINEKCYTNENTKKSDRIQDKEMFFKRTRK